MNRLRNAAILVILLVMVAAILIATGRFAVQNTQPPDVVTANVRVTAVADGPTPIAPYGPIDPAIIPALEGTPGSKPFAVLPGIQPIGVYLPSIPTPTPIPTLTLTASNTATATYSATPTQTSSPTITPSLTDTLTPTPTITPSYTASNTALPTTTLTPQPSATSSFTPSATLTRTATPTVTPSFTVTPTATRTATRTPSHTPSWTPSSTRTPTKRPTPTPFPTDEPVDNYGGLALENLRWTPNPALVGDNCAPRGLPVNGVLTQRFQHWHSGVDLGVEIGTPVLATQSGQVIFAGWSTLGYGWLVIVQNGQYITYYGHNSAFNVAQYQYVHAGDVISFSGSTGNSNGPHVHYETRIDALPVDPLTFDLRNLPTC